MSTQRYGVDAYGQVLAHNAKGVLAAARRCTWALADPGDFLAPVASDEILPVVLGAVREHERDAYVERLQSFAGQHRARLQALLRGYGPGSRPAEYGRYMLVGRPRA
ncbi:MULTISPECIES: hypothetical protein [unclassified Streptomyces]|uniref:hypothetical protein n=1 Tax=unclassified Streptomyces TaxID=2593676 RepID=UPI00093DC787|nr:hypothetical protein [Streptomyces sp. TSRI0281]OKI44748.1 hypothetical protein A6A29_33945 [Streptomyces sp. TSRI0281]